MLPALPGLAGMSGKVGKGGQKPWRLHVSICVRSPQEREPRLLKFCLLQPEPSSLRTYWAWPRVCVCVQYFKHGCFPFVGVLREWQRQTNPMLTFHCLESEAGYAGHLPTAAGRSLRGPNTCKA